ncbi:MAG: PepSY domain-containing protein [Methylobacter sp.]|nr:PepSY domain-containing protein [Methylobacter sp.]
MFKVVLLALLFFSNFFAQAYVLASVSLDEATKQIIEGTYNKVLEAHTETVGGKTIYIIKVLTPDGRIHYYKIDAETGQLVS